MSLVGRLTFWCARKSWWYLQLHSLLPRYSLDVRLNVGHLRYHGAWCIPDGCLLYYRHHRCQRAGGGDAECYSIASMISGHTHSFLLVTLTTRMHLLWYRDTLVWKKVTLCSSDTYWRSRKDSCTMLQMGSILPGSNVVLYLSHTICSMYVKSSRGLLAKLDWWTNTCSSNYFIQKVFSTLKLCTWMAIKDKRYWQFVTYR